MYGNLGEGIVTMFCILSVFAFFGLWKLGEIVYWLFTHVHIGLNP